MSSELFAAVDIGTTNVKLAFFDENGEKVFFCQQRCFSTPKDGVSEVKPEKWWATVVQCFHKADQQLRKKVVAICVTGQGPTTVLVSKSGSTVGNAITWMDKRGMEKLEQITSQGIDEQTAVGLSHLLVLNDLLQEEVFLLQPSDYIVFKLTGRLINASFPRRGYLPWYQEDLEKFRLHEKFLLPEFVPTGQIVSQLEKNVAKSLGLDHTVKVVAGAPDFAMALIGTATVEDGYLCDRGGTSQGVTLCSLVKPENKGLIVTPFMFGDLWKVSGVMNTTGAAYEWMSKNITRARLVELSKLLTVKRPTNLIFLPHLNGERSPYWNPKMKGVLFGLTLENDWKTLLVAVIEGVAFSIRQIMELMEESGCKVKAIRVTGGQALNDLWNQVKADVLNRQIEVPKIHDSELLGCAISCLSALTGEDIAELSKKSVKIEKKFYPVAQRQPDYERLYQLYKLLHERTMDLHEKL
ncbi:xylulokinase [Pseudothermotoga thermarum]|uniref:Carbohydrate kinase, FGGY n=1 Tax=Pseudothermotoga thermarum DSM 5069 TaxID=688269 RepID=F7YUZ8_9THEM|nr:FGGY-family carbohydrate kinase [Pseudothermotoga thermarum]AEH50282.1 Carbohydrate kinase, FGGY [Pseudothermotoga thermarum DSM 5069]